ncbi:DUF4124 domain-containing protein [Leucothrix arctica]|uniref:DUF4124 domain-containing protein n=1 Tax=Leucothrix arctica TaxID=1481894 RepID=A0A317CCW1_9GAMM|nr:DUF4124 domain-containing protein [Leucothrix arctica]PWQ93932.1 hypothetical protein DKT75_20250 [Leucothrix arctica]
MKILYLTTALIMLASLPVHSGLYRWVDADGKVYYSDVVPPDVAQSGHTKLRQNGMVAETIESAEARKRKIKLDQIKLARDAVEKEEQRRKDLQEMRDTQLLAMFASTEELIKIYESKLEMTDGSVAILKTRHKKLSEKLSDIEARYERMVNPNTKNMLGIKIDTILDDLHVYQQAITENLIEKTKIKKRYRSDLERFEQLSAKKKKVK